MRYQKPILDAHTHVMEGASGARLLHRIETEYGYARANALSATAWGGPAQNVQCLYIKHDAPGSYVFGSMDHAVGDFGKQCDQLAALGVDGFKMIEGKPDTYKLVGHALNSAYYDELYAFAQENGYPILAHVGDPPECWDIAKAPAFAVENGWTYTDGSFVELEELFAQVENIVTRYPKLHLILAHFFFHSQDMARAAEFLERHPNVCFDICPGTEMYENFCRDLKGAREFFLRFQDRLIFGTDNWDTVDSQEIRDKDTINRMIHSFLQTADTFPVWDHEMHGIDLPEDALDKIYRENFERLAGSASRPLNVTGLAEYCRSLLDSAAERNLAETERKKIEEVLHELGE